MCSVWLSVLHEQQQPAGGRVQAESSAAGHAGQPHGRLLPHTAG